MKKHITSILLALVLCLGLLPTSVLADEPTEYPFTPSIGEITECVKGGYTYYDMVYAPEDPAADGWGYIYPMNTADLYTVTVPYGEIGVTKETLTFLEERIAYGYDAYGGYLYSCAADAANGYGNNGRDGELTANVRLIDDLFADYIVVQTPYDKFWSSTTLYAIRFEYNTANPAEKAKMNLRWSDLSSETTSAVKNDLMLTTSDAETGAAITWNSSVPSVAAINGKVTRPAYGSSDAAVTLTATLTYDTYTETKDFQFTVPAVSGGEFNNSKLDDLLSGIAEGYVDNASEWVIMDMAAYAKYYGDAAQQTSAEAKQKYINTAINAVSKSTAGDTDYAKAILALRAIGKDPQKLYPVNSNTPINAIQGLNSAAKSSSAWSAPYTLAAYNQGSYNTDLYEDELLSALLDNQKDNGSWDEYGTIDTTGNVIAALAFYKDRAEVDAAIGKAIDYLSSQQKDSGAFDDGQTGTWAAGENVNSTAMAIIGLAANGVDPAADPRFIKNGNSALDGLMSFSLSNNSGFGYTDNSSLNAYATEQGFRALIAAAQVIKSGSAYNVYDFSANAADAARASGAGNTGAPAESTGETIRVYVTIKGDTGDYWLKRYAVKLPGEGATVYHAFTAACEANGITQTGAESGYVRAIEKSGKTLAEVDIGADSGWLYRVEGYDFPSVGLTEFAIENGDSIIWYYTNDWTVDDYAGGMAEKKPEKQPESAFIDVSENEYYTDAVAWAVENGITQGTDAAHFSPDEPCTRAQVVTFLWRAAGCPKVQDTVCRFADVETDAYYSDAVLWAVENGITNGVGETEFAPDDTVTRAQVVTFLCRFAKGNGSAQSDFTDVNENDYFSKSVVWAVENGITFGTSETTFSPNDDCVRAQVVTFLYRCFEK